MENAQGLINAKREGADVAHERIVTAMKREFEQIKANDPELFAEILVALNEIVAA